MRWSDARCYFASTRSRREPGEPLLKVADLSVLDDRGLEAVRDVTFDVRAGEIVGIAGVDGNGQSELIDALTGLRKVARGQISVGGEDLTHASARQALDAGMGHIPEDRQRRGLVLDFNLAENLALHDYGKEPFSRFGWLNPKRWLQWAGGLLKEFDVRGGGPATRGGSLSGGNQQKVVDRAGGVARSERPGRGTAHSRPRRRRDRVRAPPPRRTAGRRQGGAARLARARGDPVALGPDPGALRGAHRGRVPARRQRRGIGDRDAWRAGARRTQRRERARVAGPARRPIRRDTRRASRGGWRSTSAPAASSRRS